MTIWLSYQEISDELQIPVSSLYHYTRIGQGPITYMVGKHRRVMRSDLEAWIERHRQS